MNVTHLVEIPLTIQIHMAAAMVAIVLGPLAIYRQRRDRLHRITGFAWVGAMLVLALGSFALDAHVWPLFHGYGPIHLLSIYALASLGLGVRAARAGRIAEHRGYMVALYWQGLMVAGLLTVLPGRTLNRVLFPDAPMLGVALIGGMAGAALILALRRRLVRGPLLR